MLQNPHLSRSLPHPHPYLHQNAQEKTVQQVVLIEAATVLMGTMCKERKFSHRVSTAYSINHFLASSHQGGKHYNRRIMLQLLSWAHADSGVQTE